MEDDSFAGLVFDFRQFTESYNSSSSSSSDTRTSRACNHSSAVRCSHATSTIAPSCINDTAVVIPSIFFTYKVVVEVYVVGLLCLFGFVGNFLSIAVLCRDRDKNNTTNWLLQTLAVVDSFFLVFSFFIQPIKVVHDFTDWFPSLRRGFPYLEAHLWAFASIAQTMAVWLVTLITVDRYIAVCQPWQTNWRSLNRVKAVVVVIAVVAVVYNIPRFLERETSLERNCLGGFLIRTRKTAFRENRNYFLVYKTLCYFIFRSIGPLSILVALNVRLVRALRKVRRKHRDMTRKTKQRENITVMLIAVVTVFIVCQIPDLGLRIAFTAMEFSPVALRVDVRAMRFANAASNALLTVNSSVNFLIYCLVGKKFRRIFVRMVSCSQSSARKSIATSATGETEKDRDAGAVGLLTLGPPHRSRRLVSMGGREMSEAELMMTTTNTTTTMTTAV